MGDNTGTISVLDLNMSNYKKKLNKYLNAVYLIYYGVKPVTEYLKIS